MCPTGCECRTIYSYLFGHDCSYIEPLHISRDQYEYELHIRINTRFFSGFTFWRPEVCLKICLFHRHSTSGLVTRYTTHLFGAHWLKPVCICPLMIFVLWFQVIKDGFTEARRSRNEQIKWRLSGNNDGWLRILESLQYMKIGPTFISNRNTHFTYPKCLKFINKFVQNHNAVLCKNN